MVRLQGAVPIGKNLREGFGSIRLCPTTSRSLSPGPDKKAQRWPASSNGARQACSKCAQFEAIQSEQRALAAGHFTRPLRSDRRYSGGDLRRTNANRANLPGYQKWPMGSWTNLQPNTQTGSPRMSVAHRGVGLLRFMDHRHHGEICWLPCRIWQQAQGRLCAFDSFFSTMVD